jgi:hypothetical protein
MNSETKQAPRRQVYHGWQADALKFVASHGGHFATPHAGGGVWVYWYFTTPGGRCDIERELCENTREVRDALGY